jgi:homogentisate 1,2-dioxygenase
MPFYHTLGKIPHKRHTTFKKPDGGLYYEQLFGTVGFAGMSSLLYHIHRPTQVAHIGKVVDVTPKVASENNITSLMLDSWQAPPTDDFLEARIRTLVNQDCHISVAAPRKSMTDYFYKNTDADEVIFIHKGKGVLKTFLGDIDFGYGDYLVIPRGMIYQMHFEGADNRLFIVESFSPVYTPKRYRNHFGQLLEHAPYCERDIRKPQNINPQDEKGEFLLKIKKRNAVHHLTYASHPFDVVGWDGYNYPYAFNIKDFEPITGRVHQPPPVHQTFESGGFVICSFVPRLYDYHPESIPAPYNHSNIDSDEVLYYVDGDFMSRAHVDKGFISLHPAGIPHGPHPGLYEKSVGQTKTEELAVMVDTFRPLMVTQEALDLSTGDYWKSWLEH